MLGSRGVCAPRTVPGVRDGLPHAAAPSARCPMHPYVRRILFGLIVNVQAHCCVNVACSVSGLLVLTASALAGPPVSTEGWMYWADFASNSIRRAHLDGSGMEV